MNISLKSAMLGLESGVSFANPDKNQYQARIDNLTRAHKAANEAFLSDPLRNPKFLKAMEYSKKFAPYDVSKIESAARDFHKHLVSLLNVLEVQYNNVVERAERDGVRVNSRLL